MDMPSDDLGYDHGVGDIDIPMLDENADESMSEEIDEISSPNWREEVCIYL